MMMYPPAESGGDANTLSAQAGHRPRRPSTAAKWKTQGYGREIFVLRVIKVELPPRWREKVVKKIIGGVYQYRVY
ncbi:MAG: hypothetical protein ACJAST_001604 [Halopseudomonas sp.]|jgi:hypothetical protein